MSCLYHLRKTEVYKQQFTVVGGGGGVEEGGGLPGSINFIFAGCLTTGIGERLNKRDIMC